MLYLTISFTPHSSSLPFTPTHSHSPSHAHHNLHLYIHSPLTFSHSLSPSHPHTHPHTHTLPWLQWISQFSLPGEPPCCHKQQAPGTASSPWQHVSNHPPPKESSTAHTPPSWRGPGPWRSCHQFCKGLIEHWLNAKLIITRLPIEDYRHALRYTRSYTLCHT